MAWHLVSSPEVGHWVAAQTGGDYDEKKSQAIGFVRDDKLIAGFIYEKWNGQSVFCHLAIKGKINRTFLKVSMGYAFEGIGAKKIIGTVLSSNVKSIKAAKTLGFVQEACITNAAPTGDVLFFTMTAEQCRFFGGK